MTIGERLKNLREQNKMTLEEVAHQLGIGRSTVFRYENGTVTNIPSDKISMLARIYGGVQHNPLYPPEGILPLV